MKALVSGQAGLALTLSDPFEIRGLDEEPRRISSPSAAMRLFAGCSDVIEHDVSSVAELNRILEFEWAKDRALRLFLLLIDPQEPVDELEEYAQSLEELIVDREVLNFLQLRMLSDNFPILIDIKRVMEAAESCPLTTEIFEHIVDAQGVIKKAKDAFNDLDSSKFDNEKSKRQLFGSIIREGYFGNIVSNIIVGKDISLDKLKMINAHLPYREPLSQWAAMLQSGPLKVRPHEKPEESADEQDWLDDGEEHRSNHGVYESVREKVFQINELLKQRDLIKASTRTEQLIAQQRSNSTSEQIAKSLCNLAQRAKLQEISELHLKWSEWATRENPADPMTYGHFADALVSMGELDRANEVFNACEAVGGRLFAEGGRARILRILGQLEEARQRYLDVAKEFADTPGVEHAWIGAADTLREMGRTEESIAEFKDLTRQWPFSSAAWNGLAGAFLEAGRLDEAVRTFGKSIANVRTAAAFNGRARALRLAGNFDRALSLYNEVLVDFPNNVTALCGRAEVFRAQGRFSAALHAYDLAVERCPYSTSPINGRAAVLLQTGSYSNALAAYELAYKKFHQNEQASAGIVRSKMMMGRYEEALVESDRRIYAAPFSTRLKVLRAQILQRMDRLDASLEAYNAILALIPNNLYASIGKASVLISLRRYEEAARLLPDSRPITRSDWTRYVLRSFLIQEDRTLSHAVSHLERGLRACPFFLQRKLLRNALVSLEIQRGKSEVARQIVEEAPEEISSVIAFHAYASARRPVQARAEYQTVISSGLPSEVIILAQEIGRRFRVFDEKPTKSINWIARVERNFIINQAA